jgi:beta-mannosidase
MAQALAVHNLTSGWSFRQTDDPSEDTWLPVARVPTNVHLDLIDHEKYVLYMRESTVIL